MSGIKAVLCGIIFTFLLIVTFAGGSMRLIYLCLLLLPLYYSGKNLVQQNQIAGSWTIIWKNFLAAFVLELIGVGIPFGFWAINRLSLPYQSVIPGFVVYIIVTAVAYGLTKKQDSKEYPKS